MPKRSKHPGVKLVKKTRKDASGKVISKLVIRYREFDYAKGDYRQREEDLKANYGVNTKSAALPFLLRIHDRLEADKRSRLRRGGTVATTITFAQAFEAYGRHWEESRIEKMGKEGAVKSRKQMMNSSLSRFINWLESEELLGKPCMALKPERLRDFAQSLRYDKDGGITKGSTRNRWQGAAATFLRWLRKNEWSRITNDEIEANTERFQVVKEADRILTSKEIGALMLAASELDIKGSHWGLKTRPIFPWLFLSLTTGARPAEVLRIRWQDIDLERGWIHLTDTKTDAISAFPLGDSPCLLRFLKEYPRTETYICGDGKNGNPQAVLQKRRRKRLGVAAGNILAGLEFDADTKGMSNPPEPLEFTPYMFRHAAVSYFRQYARGYAMDHARFRFRHSDAVAKTHYQKLPSQIEDRGATIESWYGCAEEIENALDAVLKHAQMKDRE